MQASDNFAAQCRAEATRSESLLSDDEETAVARLICEEVLNGLISSALVTSAINVLVSYKHTKSIDHIFRYLPNAPPTVAAAIRGMALTKFDGATLGTLGTLFEKIQVGKALIKQCRVFDGRCNDLNSKELAELALCWRQVCALGIAALCCLERGCKAVWSADRLRTLDKLVELLGNARNGESPYLGVDGYPLIPQWAEQRRHRRQSVDLEARVHADSEIQHAKVVDISHEGIGLDRIFGLRPGQRLAVVFDDRRVVGIVTWTGGGRAGIQICA
jgi:hypothetical protein